MLAMENSSRHGKLSQSNSSFKHRRSGYEPSDTDTDWMETPGRNISPLGRNKRYLLNLDSDISSPVRAPRTSPVRRRNSKSPYKPRRIDGSVISAMSSGSDLRRNISPLESEGRRNISPYKARREESSVDDGEFVSSSRKQNHRIHLKRLDTEEDGVHSQFVAASTNYNRRSLSAPRPRAKEKEQQINLVPRERKGSRSPSPLSRTQIRKQKEASHTKAPSASEINEMVANVKLSKGPVSDPLKMESTDTISPEDIFFSRDYMALASASKKNVLTKTNGFGNSFPPRLKVVSERDSASHQRGRVNDSFNQNNHVVSSSTVTSQTNTSSSYAVSRHSMSKSSIESSKISDGSGRSSDSFRKFTANRQKSQKDLWFGCVRKGPCRTSKSAETRDFDETSFIEKAFVVENIRQFWADKHRPGSLSGFTCHKQQAQLLRQLISHSSCPHILFKGPSGSGKKSLTMALLHEIYGDPAWNVSHELRYFHIQENRPMQVVFPLTSSPHHVELNLKLESHNARYALMALVKELTNNHAIAPEISTVGFRADYKVIVLYEVDKLAENVQHLIKWIMDCYTDACKIILCCEDDVEILDLIKNRCKVITVDAPVTHEIMEVLIQIARKENFDLPMSFAAKIATKSKQNLRKAIMALEACKSHNYPFVDEQPIPVGWEEVLMELAAEILADPSPKRLFFVRGKFQKLLVDFIHPKLILQKLVEQFLKGVESSLKRELYYWHAYYDKRLPMGTSALLKLEEFVAKFMSIHRKSFRVNHIHNDNML